MENALWASSCPNLITSDTFLCPCLENCTPAGILGHFLLICSGTAAMSDRGSAVSLQVWVETGDGHMHGLPFILFGVGGVFYSVFYGGLSVI